MRGGIGKYRRQPVRTLLTAVGVGVGVSVGVWVGVGVIVEVLLTVNTNSGGLVFSRDENDAASILSVASTKL